MNKEYISLEHITLSLIENIGYDLINITLIEKYLNEVKANDKYEYGEEVTPENIKEEIDDYFTLINSIEALAI